MKVIITGAHFTPAVATIEQLKKYQDVNLIYVGRKTTLEGDNTPSVESQILPQLKIKFIPLIMGRLQRDFTIYTIPSLMKIPIGFLQALYIIIKEKPNVILSFGGYVSVPMVIIAWLFSIPIIIHEQSLVLGLANKICSPFADKIALAFDKGYGLKEEKTIVVGNPIREEIIRHDGEVSPEYQKIFTAAKKNHLPIILITGGNQGSHVVNLAAEEILETLLKMACVIHITGDNKFKDFERQESLGKSGELGELGERYIVKKWIGKEMGFCLSNADLIISRAGANTLTESTYFEKKVLAIPIPYLYQDEQMKNAKYFEQFGNVRILFQSKLSGENLFNTIKIMLKDLNKLNQKAKEIKKTIIVDAAKRLALETILLAENV